MRKNLIVLMGAAWAALAFGEGEVNLFRNSDFNEGVTGWGPGGGVVRQETMPIAGTALLLASDAGRYITGASIKVDGGLSLPG